MLYIVITKDLVVDHLGYEDRRVSCLEEVERWVVDSTVIVSDAHLYAGSERELSELNRLFCFKVIEAVEKGSSIFLFTYSLNMIDKRLRDKAVVIVCPWV